MITATKAKLHRNSTLINKHLKHTSFSLKEEIKEMDANTHTHTITQSHTHTHIHTLIHT